MCNHYKKSKAQFYNITRSMLNCFSTIVQIFIFFFPIFLYTAETYTTPSATLAPLPFQIKLQEPIYIDGTLKTSRGGVIQGKDIYIQAKYIDYTQKPSETPDRFIHTIEASEQLYMLYRGVIYKGRKILFDCTTGILTVWDGVVQYGNWVIEGQKIVVDPKGEATFERATLSAAMSDDNDNWSIRAKSLTLYNNQYIQAHNVFFHIAHIPVLWIPKYRKNLSSASSSPLHYKLKWKSGSGFTLGVSYTLPRFQKNWRSKLYLDHNVQHGTGAGVRLWYKDASRQQHLDMLYYFATTRVHFIHPHNIRYRVQGIYKGFYERFQLHCLATYDKLSDRSMKSRFSAHALSGTRPALTQFTLWKETTDWLIRFNTRVRLNSFQTVKQELPLLTIAFRPHQIGRSRWMLDTCIHLSYLKYTYMRHSEWTRNFSSTRHEIIQKAYTTYSLHPFTITPLIGYRLIQYSSSPQHRSRVQFLGELNLHVKTQLAKITQTSSQLLEPYIFLQSIIHPTQKPGSTYIFSTQDCWNTTRTVYSGVRYTRMQNTSYGFQQCIHADLFGISYIQAPKSNLRFRKVQLKTSWNATDFTSYKIDSAYNTRYGRLEHWNIAARYTLSSKIAFILEYRQRNKFSWRKLEEDNFILEATRSTRSLLSSPLSDARRSILASMYYSPHPDYAVEITSIHGFRSKKYQDIEVGFFSFLQNIVHLRLGYGYRTHVGHRWNISFNLGPRKVSTSTGFHKIGEGSYHIW